MDIYTVNFGDSEWVKAHKLTSTNSIISPYWNKVKQRKVNILPILEENKHLLEENEVNKYLKQIEDRNNEIVIFVKFI